MKNGLFYMEKLINNNPENLRMLSWIQATKGKAKSVTPKWYDIFEEKLYDSSLYFTQ